MYLASHHRARRSDAIFCVAVTGCVALMVLIALRPMLGLLLLSTGAGGFLVPRKHWTRDRLSLACCMCGLCLLCGVFISRHSLRLPAPAPALALPSHPDDEVPPPPRPPPRPTALSSCSFLRHRSPTAACDQHSHSRAVCSRRYVRLQEDGRQLSSMCVYDWREVKCTTAEIRYECRKLGLSDGFVWNLVRALLLLVALAALPVALPWVQRQLPSYGLMSGEAYEKQCELTTDRELAKLRSHVQLRGMPPTLSAHAQDRTQTFAEGLSGFRRMDALRWMQHVLSPEKRAAIDGFVIGDDGRRVDMDDDNVSLSEGSDHESDRE